ncbi:MAG: hypothetical protein ACFFG0_00880 [Candidatus Thorarchaeota archaeon]
MAKLIKRDCPNCKNWWFTRTRKGCFKNHKYTNTTLAILEDRMIKKNCSDFEKLKGA